MLPPIAELLPHDAPMVLLDEVGFWESPVVRCVVRLTDASPFVVDGRAPAVVALEYMAQTVGVWVGLSRRERGQRPVIGFLVGTRQVDLNVDAFDVGDELEVESIRRFGEEKLGSFDCITRRRGEVVSKASVNVYQGELPEIGVP